MITMKSITLLLGIFLLYPTLVIGQEEQQEL